MSGCISWCACECLCSGERVPNRTGFENRCYFKILFIDCYRFFFYCGFFRFSTKKCFTDFFEPWPLPRWDYRARPPVPFLIIFFFSTFIFNFSLYNLIKIILFPVIFRCNFISPPSSDCICKFVVVFCSLIFFFVFCCNFLTFLEFFRIFFGNFRKKNRKSICETKETIESASNIAQQIARRI